MACWLLLGALAQVCAEDYMPGRKLEDDLAKPPPLLLPGYAAQRPRLLFEAGDKAQLVAKRARVPAPVWEELLRQARGLGAVPSAEEIRDGKKYWRAEWIFSGALAHFLTGEQGYRDGAVKWMAAHCQVDVWGTAFNSNQDLEASWYLYYISLAYDLLHSEMSASERKTVRDGLAAHAKIIYASKKPPQQYRYDQNHTYIPVTALGAAALALAGEVPEADEWLKRAYALMRRCRYVLGEDGYYYEGTGYCRYALHWHVRWADLLARATGEKAHDLPTLKNMHLFLLHLALPGSPFSWDLGDSGNWTGKRPVSKAASLGWMSCLYGLASSLGDGRIQAVAGRLAQGDNDISDPAQYFLWYDPHVRPAGPEEFEPYHYFPDHGAVAWRSSWKEDAAVYLFKCGPPEGHAAAGKQKRMDDWTMNHGHVHPDIGMFWLYAQGQYLAVDTGYTANKRTADHNTLLVDGYGQGHDGSYWVYRDLPYEKFDKVRIEKVHLEEQYGYALGDLSAAYHPEEKLGKLSLLRHVVMSARFLLVLDELSSEKPHTYSWLLHADENFRAAGAAFVTEKEGARLLAYVLAPRPFVHRLEPTLVLAGKEPGKGKETQRGHQLVLETEGQVTKTRFLVVLVPAAKAENDPSAVEVARADDQAVEFKITWADGAKQAVTLDLAWRQEAAGAKGPVTFSSIK